MHAHLPPPQPLPWDLPRQADLYRDVAGLQIIDAERDPHQALDQLAGAGLLRECVPDAHGGVSPRPELRALCAVRCALAYRSPLHDLMFAMQGLGSYPVTLHGTAEQRAGLLPLVARGQAICAFAVTEPEAGSDLSAVRTSARRVPGPGDCYIIDGDKVFISNAGIATSYLLFARTGEHPHRGLSAFLVSGDAPGLTSAPQRLLCDDHPIGALSLRGVTVPLSARVGEEGQGMSILLSTLGFFRASVGAAALGLAQRALDEARAHALVRSQFGKRLADFQATQMALAEMATAVDGAALLVQRAAYLVDAGQAVTREVSMAKLQATEVAQQVVDRALQLHGGKGLLAGSIMERLYREVRALRIYEGTSEIQKLVIARELLR